MRTRKARRTPYHSHEMQGNSPRVQRVRSSVSHKYATYPVVTMDTTSQNISAARAVLYVTEEVGSEEEDMVQRWGQGRCSPWGSMPNSNDPVGFKIW